MSKILFTLTGCQYYLGTDLLEKDMKLKLKKEPDNAWDKDAIMVKYKGLQVGYVANNYHTKVKDTYSAGRLYDRIGKKAKAKVICVIPNGAICEITDFGLSEKKGKED